MLLLLLLEFAVGRGIAGMVEGIAIGFMLECVRDKVNGPVALSIFDKRSI